MRALIAGRRKDVPSCSVGPPSRQSSPGEVATPDGAAATSEPSGCSFVQSTLAFDSMAPLSTPASASMKLVASASATSANLTLTVAPDIDIQSATGVVKDGRWEQADKSAAFTNRHACFSDERCRSRQEV